MTNTLASDVGSCLARSDAPASVILVRLIVGGVSLSEGIQKFLYPDALGVGRFVKIGIAARSVMARAQGDLLDVFADRLRHAIDHVPA